MTDDLAATLAAEFGYREYMVRRYLGMFGDAGTRALLVANDRPLRPVIRVNTLKVPVDRLVRRLEGRGYRFRPVENLPAALTCEHAPHPLGATHEYMLGWYYLQGEASQYPVHVLARDWTPETVVDMCAAPGSKATQLAQRMENRGQLVLFDREASRIRSLRANLSRMGVTNALVVLQDAREIARARIRPDHVLLDAPCTGEGIIRQDPRRKTNRTMADVTTLSQVQGALLETGLRVLAPGGELVYSTCSVAPEENEFVVHAVLQGPLGKHVQLLPADLPGAAPGFTRVLNRNLSPSLERCARFLPHVHDTEGFFIARFKKRP